MTAPKNHTTVHEHKLVLDKPCVGLDLSLTNSAMGVLTTGRLVTHRFASNDLRGCTRLQWIVDQILDRVPSDAFVNLEGYSMGSMHSHAHSLGELGGVVKLSLLRQKHVVMVTPPTSLKKFVTGKGNAKGKGPLMLDLFKRWGLTVDQDDEADATALAVLAGYQTFQLSLNDLTAAQREGLSKTEVLKFGPAAPTLPKPEPQVRVRTREKILQPVAK